jgi:hypothetical protein
MFGGMFTTKSIRLPAYARDLAILTAVQTFLLIFFISIIPLPRMYAWADGAEYQRIVLYIVGQGDLKHGYPQAFLPGQSFVVAAFYLITGNIQYASLVTNFMFGLASLFTLRFLTGNLRLSILFIFVPYWLVLSFSTLADTAFILMELVVALLVIRHEWARAVLIGSLSMLFRPEGLFLMVALAILIFKKGKFQMRLLAAPAIAILAIMIWGQVAFGNPLYYFLARAAADTALNQLFQQLASDYSFGLLGKVKIAYMIATLIASLLTLGACYRRYGVFHFFFLESLVLTLAHTALSPPSLYGLAKLYPQVAPFTIIVFGQFLLKRWAIALLVLVLLSMIIALLYWTVTWQYY